MDSYNKQKLTLRVKGYRKEFADHWLQDFGVQPCLCWSGRFSRACLTVLTPLPKAGLSIVCCRGLAAPVVVARLSRSLISQSCGGGGGGGGGCGGGGGSRRSSSSSSSLLPLVVLLPPPPRRPLYYYYYHCCCCYYYYSYSYCYCYCYCYRYY